MEKEIKSFVHYHRLILRDGKDNDEVTCWVCLQLASGPIYGCKQCKGFVVHKSCADLSQEIQYPFHPKHPLTLFSKSPYDSGKCHCDVCGKSCSGFVYHCADCRFNLDIECALSRPIIIYAGRHDCNSLIHDGLVECCYEINHEEMVSVERRYIERRIERERGIESFIHDHPLCFEGFNMVTVLICWVCNRGIELLDPMYGCIKCWEFLVHKSCAKLPEQIFRHPFHSQHTLSIFHRSPYDNKEYRCDACQTLCTDFLFQCECGFILDIQCASLKAPESYEGHPHPLISLEKNYPLCKCDICKFTENGPILRCVECSYNVHESCAELPRLFRHPFHPLHPLSPTGRIRRCNACKITDSCRGYCCNRCNFYLHRTCASQIPTIRCQGHDHLLTLFEEFDEEKVCTSCRTPCGTAAICSCVVCDFTLHLHCHPSLPLTVRHECHIDPLTLTESVVQEDNDSDEFYCDACETRRNPKHPVYYCEECDFVAHIECVISKVLPSLVVEQGKHVAMKGEIKPTSTWDRFLGATIGDEVVARGVSAALPNEEVEVEVTAGFNLPKFDEEIAKLEADSEAMTMDLPKLDKEIAKVEGEIEAMTKDIEAMTAKLDAKTAKLAVLQGKRAQCVALLKW